MLKIFRPNHVICINAMGMENIDGRSLDRQGIIAYPVTRIVAFDIFRFARCERGVRVLVSPSAIDGIELAMKRKGEGDMRRIIT